MVLFSKFEKEDIERVKEIISVFSKYGFQDILKDFGLEKFSIFRKSFYVKPFPVRTRMAFEELGGTFVKLGQLLSTRQDLVSEDFVKQFELLKDDVKPFSYSLVKKEIENELNASIEELFLDFDKKPIASASIGQVHKAKLLNGRVVAVKIQRPEIFEKIKRDLRIMNIFIDSFFKTISWIKKHDIDFIFREFERSILRELDYSAEANNISIFCKNFKYEENIKIPKIYENYSTKKILIMEFIDGKNIGIVSKYKKTKLNKKLISNRIVDSFFKQMFVYRFIHADPHSGNIFVLPENKIAFLDFGACLHITENSKNFILELASAIIKIDVNKITRLVMSISNNPSVDEFELSRDIQDLMDKYYQNSLEKINFSDLIFGIMNLFFKYKLKVSGEYISLLKINSYVEDIGMRLDPKMDIISISKPYIDKFVHDQYGPVNIFKRFKKIVSDNYSFLEKFPDQAKSIMSRLQSGKVDVEIKGDEVDELEQKISNSGNRVSIGLVLAALIISSTMTLNMGFKKIVFGFPVISFVGYIFSIIVGVWLLISFISSKFNK